MAQPAFFGGFGAKEKAEVQRNYKGKVPVKSVTDKNIHSITTYTYDTSILYLYYLILYIYDYICEFRFL